MKLIYVHNYEASNHNTLQNLTLWHKKWATLTCIQPHGWFFSEVIRPQTTPWNVINKEG
jgi:hypothetical protein